mmetsp:Transcript_68766/g.212643  ORF Transcript_68766/g.212643 Transcript_68766/m.212643 type:complete len:230 (+) Transcript_68766:1578-2267(+)
MDRNEKRFSARDMNDRLGAVVMSRQMSEHESMVRRFCERSSICREGQSQRACTNVLKAESLMEALRRRACWRSFALIHWSTTRISLVDTCVPRSRSACSSSSAILSFSLFPEAAEALTGGPPVPLDRSWTFLSSAEDSAWIWSRRVTSSSNCRVSLTIRFFMDSSSALLCWSNSVLVWLVFFSDSTLCSNSESSSSRLDCISCSSFRSRAFSAAMSSGPPGMPSAIPAL